MRSAMERMVDQIETTAADMALGVRGDSTMDQVERLAVDLQLMAGRFRRLFCGTETALRLKPWWTDTETVPSPDQCNELAQETIKYDMRCEAYELLGITRSDAQGVVDAEIIKGGAG